MSRTQSALFVLLLVALLAVLPAAHPEARLFSDGWGASSFIDPNFCITPIEGQPPRMALLPKTPAAAQVIDRVSLAGQYLTWGLLLPMAALLAVLRFGVRYPLSMLFGLFGAVPAWFQWTLNPAFVALRQGLAELWLARWPLAENQFAWLDGMALALWLAGGALLAGGASFTAIWAAARLAGLDWHRLARDLVPLAAIVLFLGLTQTTALYLRGEGANLDWLPAFRAVLIVLTVAASGWLGLHRLLKVGAGRMKCPEAGTAYKAAAGLLWAVPLALVAAHGWAMYFHWVDRYHV